MYISGIRIRFNLQQNASGHVAHRLIDHVLIPEEFMLFSQVVHVNKPSCQRQAGALTPPREPRPVGAHPFPFREIIRGAVLPIMPEAPPAGGSGAGRHFHRAIRFELEILMRLD